METLTKYEKELNYVRTHLTCLSTSEIEKLYKNVYVQTFKETTGIPIGRNYTVSFVPVKKVDKNEFQRITNYYLNFDLHIYENVNIIEKHLSENGINFNEFKEFLLFSYLFTECCFSFSTEYSCIKPNSLPELIQFIYYIETGIYENYDVLKGLFGVEFKTITLDITIGSLKVKCFKNGKINIKGLNSKQSVKIKRFDELKHLLPKHEY